MSEQTVRKGGVIFNWAVFKTSFHAGVESTVIYSYCSIYTDVCVLVYNNWPHFAALQKM